MKNSVKLLISILVLALPMAALAAPDDAAYCKSLAATYEGLLMNEAPVAEAIQNGVETSLALDQCKNGNAAGIPVLEQKLRDLKIDLPPRN